MFWTYDQYLDNPVWFNRLLFDKLNMDVEYNESLKKQQ